MNPVAPKALRVPPVEVAPDFPLGRVAGGVSLSEAHMVNDSKHTEQVKLTLTERELLDASRIAASEDRTLADFIRLTLRTAMYGKVSRLASQVEGTNEDRKS